ncbi:MAG TPA: PspC domain-containing protein, partial [Dehalococcoidia bacterium]|nr:PspC domain-containing protein [Dehalococcoidia bacterium]
MERRLHRSEEERVIFGVCGGIAAYLDLDPTLVRVLFVLGAVFSSGFVILAYIVLAVIMPAAERAGRIT